MTPEQKASLDRLRKHEAIIGSDYRTSPYYVEGRGVVSDEWWKDVFAAKNLAQSEHPDDDDVPVSGEWLESVGGLKSRADSYTWVFPFIVDDGWHCCITVSHGYVRIDGITVIVSPTRGNVRRLCRELRIELKE